jgi:hypothetical protein
LFCTESIDRAKQKQQQQNAADGAVEFLLSAQMVGFQILAAQDDTPRLL